MDKFRKYKINSLSIFITEYNKAILVSRHKILLEKCIKIISTKK